MTGTAMTEANEFWKIYKLDVIAIPTNRPLIRINHADVILRTEREKWEAAVEEIETVHKFDVLELKNGTQLVGSVVRESDGTVDFQAQEDGAKNRQSVARDQILA